jgi:SAM-dependent methyltransferase
MEEHLYRTFYEIEERHWWFVARQRIVQELIERRLKLPAGAHVLDVGCGTGAILKMLSQRYETYGTDTSPVAIEFSKKRGLSRVSCCTLETFPQADVRFDLITLLDVIEHLDDDRGMLQQASYLLKTGGAILLTVPAYRWLWSNHDEANQHKRRYVREELREVLEGAGYRIELLSYYNTFLFPLALIDRLAERILHRNVNAALTIPPRFINSVFASIFSSERFILRRMTFPFGLSLIALGRKS